MAALRVVSAGWPRLGEYGSQFDDERLEAPLAPRRGDRRLPRSSSRTCCSTSRSVSVLLPLALLGVLLAGARLERSRNLVLGALVVLNLALPASHVVRTFEIPITHLVGEMKRAKSPPPQMRPSFYVDRASASWQAGDLLRALRNLDLAIRLDGSDPSPLFFRGRVHDRLGRVEQAIADFRAALKLAPAGWTFRETARHYLEQLISRIPFNGKTNRLRTESRRKPAPSHSRCCSHRPRRRAFEQRSPLAQPDRPHLVCSA